MQRIFFDLEGAWPKGLLLAASETMPHSMKGDSFKICLPLCYELNAWCDTHHIKLHFIQPGRPMQNGYVERFNGSFRTKILDAYIFGSLEEVRELAHEWIGCYNYEGPHDALNVIPPALFREQLEQQTTTQTTPQTTTSNNNINQLS